MNLKTLALLTSIATGSAGATFAQSPPQTNNAATATRKTTATGLGYTVIRQGLGERPGIDDIVTFHYKGSLAASGKVFDNSYDRGEPLKGGVKDMIPGMAEGLQLMPAGSKYILYIPAKLGYGSEGGGGGIIPPGADLVFEIELKKVEEPEIVAPTVAELAEASKARDADPRLAAEANAAAGESLEVILKRGQAAQKSGNFAAALKDGEAAVGLAPRDPNALVLRALARGKTKNYTGALQDYTAIISLIGDKAGNVYYWRGEVYEAMRNYSAAQADYEKMIALKPGAATAITARDRVKKAQAWADINTQMDTESKKVAAAAAPRDDNRPFMKAMSRLNADLKTILNRDNSVLSAANRMGEARTRLTQGMKELETYNDPTWPVFKAEYEKMMGKLSQNIK